MGTGHGNSVLEVVQTFEKATGQKLNYIIGPRRPGDVPAIYADATKAEEVLGFKTDDHAWKILGQLLEVAAVFG